MTSYSNDAPCGHHAHLISFNNAIQESTFAKIGGQEAGTDEEQDNLGRVEMGSDFLSPVGASTDGALVPQRDQSFPLEGSEVIFKFLAESVVCLCISVEKVDRLFV